MKPVHERQSVPSPFIDQANIVFGQSFLSNIRTATMAMAYVDGSGTDVGTESVPEPVVNATEFSVSSNNDVPDVINKRV